MHGAVQERHIYRVRVRAHAAILTAQCCVSACQNIPKLFWDSFRDPHFLSYPPWEHVYVFIGDAGDGFSGDGVGRGAAPWAGIRVPVVTPLEWSVYELRVGLRELERIRRETDAAIAVLIGATPVTRDTATALARTTGISEREAKRRTRIADVIKKLPAALGLLADGRITDEHVFALAPIADLPGAASLLDDAASTTPEDFATAVEQFRLAQSTGEDMAARQRARRCLRFYSGPDGMIGLTGLLPPMEGVELKNRLAAIVDAQWRVDHPDRAKTLGAHGGDTYEQRTADALLAITGTTGVTTRTTWEAEGSVRGPDDGSQAEMVNHAVENPVGTPAGHPPEVPLGLGNQNEPAEEQLRQASGPVGEPFGHGHKVSQKAGEETVDQSSHSTTDSADPENIKTQENNCAPNTIHETVDTTFPSSHQTINSSGEADVMHTKIIDQEIATTRQSQHRTDHPPNAPPSPVARPQITEVNTAKPAVIIVIDIDKWEAHITGAGPIPITESLLDQTRNDLYYCYKNRAGEILKFGRSRRDPTPIQRLALVVRDQHCQYPGCHAPPEKCDIHHTNEIFKDNGATDVDVMALFCRTHHQHLHLNNLTATREPNSGITIRNRKTGFIETQTTGSNHPTTRNTAHAPRPPTFPTQSAPARAAPDDVRQQAAQGKVKRNSIVCALLATVRQS